MRAIYLNTDISSQIIEQLIKDITIFVNRKIIYIISEYFIFKYMFFARRLHA